VIFLYPGGLETCRPDLRHLLKNELTKKKPSLLVRARGINEQRERLTVAWFSRYWRCKFSASGTFWPLLVAIRPRWPGSTPCIWFLPRDTMLARYMQSSCVHPSVRPSVTSQHCIRKAQHRITQTTPKDSSFLLPNPTRSPPKGRLIELGRLQSAIFHQYLAISQKRFKIGT